MGQPVKLSATLILDARLTSQISQRSIAGQIEYWARIGRAIEPLLQGVHALALSQAGSAMPLSDCLATVDSPAGRTRLATHLETLPYPHYEPAPEAPGLLLRTTADGQRTLGRFVRREFTPVTPPLAE
jgi:ParD-like antitoxin of type II bacterial toxin-antitoxin system